MLRGAFSVLMTTGLILGSVVAVGAVVGLTLPATHQAARSARFHASPARVFSIIADVKAYPEWRSDVDRIEVLSGDTDGLRFAEHSRERPEAITYRVEERNAPTLFKIRVDDPELPFGATWTYLLQPFDGGTSVTITEDGQITNPLFRVVARVLFKPTDAMDRYLHDLGNIEGLGNPR
jgi:hypothetical protein